MAKQHCFRSVDEGRIYGLGKRLRVGNTFLGGHALIYEENAFTKNTLQEVAFLLNELSSPRGTTILNVGYGTGHHSIELARRSYAVTSLDLSRGMLAKAEEEASAAGVRVEWVLSDPTRFSLPRMMLPPASVKGFSSSLVRKMVRLASP